MSEIKHVGRWEYRLAPSQGNPREVAFAKLWQEENETRQLAAAAYGCTLEILIDRPITQENATDAATLIQWLGSNVGFCFLNEALKKAGYKIERS